jgi:aminomethyltransferase
VLRKTALHDKHVALGARMGEFAGYDMPLFYKDGVINEHEWVRTHCGIFDVSHMGQVTIEGAGVAEFFERVTPSSFKNKAIGRAQYSVLTNEEGGIIDDLIVTRFGENEFFAVINAGCKDKDIAWLKLQLPSNLKLYHMQNHALIAIQGRWAERIVHEIFDYNAVDLPYMHAVKAQTKYGIPVFISRLGYTGEDGFEISLPNDEAPEIWDQLTAHSEIKPIGLAARDSLRLEMGYPLYGHDIDEKTSPIEADIAWIMGKDNTNFIGAERVLKDKKDGTARKRVGIKLMDKGVAREGALIVNGHGEQLGVLTSGGHSPIIKGGIGQGYIQSKLAVPGTTVFVNVRDRNIPAEITPMPFIRPKTKSMKKAEAA